DKQVLLAEDQVWMESSSDSDQEINANMVFMAQIKKVFLIKRLAHQYHDNSTDYGLFVNNDDDQEIFHDAIESASENFTENHIDSQKDYDNSDVAHNDSEEKDHLVDKLIRKFNKKIVKCQKCIEKANQQSKDFENQNKDLQDKYYVLKNKTTTFEMNNKELNEQLKELIEKNNDLLAQMKLLKEQLQVKYVVIDTHAECQKNMQNLMQKDMKKIIIDLEDEVVSLLEKEKTNLETIESLKSKGFESSENVSYESENKTENDCLVVEKEYEENPKVIAPGMFKLSVSQCVSPISMSKSS
nr:hypothetical protein [Tanacetum cinerariifolium]